mmetsp:Transcript_29750/g.54538  ORF Transcript_29750/g.54538 Transcript_29750/m.54538 type:complete len:86 (-) Transcript_29750:786-1043(-)
MGHNIPSNRFDLRASKEATGAIQISGDYLVGNNDSDTEFISKTLEGTKKATEMDLANAKLAASVELAAIKGCSTVDDNKSEPGIG